MEESAAWRGSFLRFKSDEDVGPRTVGPVAAGWSDPRLRDLEGRLVHAWDAVREASRTERVLGDALSSVAALAARELRQWGIVPDLAASFEALVDRLVLRATGDGQISDREHRLAVEELKGILYLMSANIRGILHGSGKAPRARVKPRPGALRELARAHAYPALPMLTQAERTRWEERRSDMSRELVLYLARPLERAAARAWRITLGSLGQLRSATQDGPGWLKDRYGEEERRRLQAYAEAHVDVLCALLSRRSK